MDRMAECNISEVLEAIKQADPENNIVSNNIDQDLNLIYPSQNQNQNMMNNYTPPGYNGKIPTGIVEIIEQPASKALRFRYKCEGRSAGSIPGVHSTPDVKTFPTIRIAGYKGKAICVVSCVTKDPPYRPHPHSLVGKENCRKGVCTVQFPQDTMTITFDKLGVQCVKKKEIEEALRVREEIRVDPFKTGFDHKKNPSSIDLNVIRLCFQVFVMNKEGKFNRGLAPVVSEPIYDKKANSDLMICKMSHCSASVHGGTEMIILCERVNKDDIQIVFYEESNGKVIWEGLGDFTPPQVHKQVGISFRTPAYHDPMIDRTVHAYVQLRRPSDGMTSESIQFNFLPSGRPGNLYSLRRALARKSFNNDTVSNDVTFNNNINVNRYLMDINLESKVRQSPLRPSQKCTLENRASQTSCTNLNNENTIGPDFNKAQNEWLDCNDVNRWVEQSQEAIVKLPCADELETASLNNSAADQCLDELLSQVVELDKIYEDTQAKLMNDQHEAMEIQSDVRDDQTYTSLQLAMKNPLWVNQEVAPSQEPFNKEQTPPTPPLPRRDAENKVPPLPPKRIRKTPSMPVLTNQMFYAPNKTLPSSPKLVTKPGLFSKLFSRKPKKDASYPNNGLTGITNNTIRCESMPPVRAMARLDGDETPPYGAELTDVEHYALYTAMAPRATDSEFDEMSFYYSPVEGGKILLEAKQTG
ncbi:hypothetical protein TKK_0005839 [Trichogramma kaykai]|uniref:RHD domain-containing protein n=1 Tax=Trichogramma kaykai TaxID=54128 RepID=A0ABD2XHJ0_9HYME